MTSLQSWTKALGTVLQYSYFSVISRFPLKTVHTFQNFLAVLPPPTLCKVETSEKILDTRVQHCLWGEGRGWTCVNWKTSQKRESVPRLLSRIVGSEFKTCCRRCYKFLGRPWPAMREYHFLKPIFHHFHAMKRLELKKLGKKKKKKRKRSHTALSSRAC